jgi:hypothetical protein
VGKGLGALLILIGCAAATVAMIAEPAWAQAVVAYLQENVLGNKGLLP